MTTHALRESHIARSALIAVALLFIGLFVLLPLAAVFAEALKHGIEAFAAAIIEPDALAAVRLTLLVAAISVPLNVLFRSEEHTSELQSLMRISYAVFCLKKKKQNNI